MPVSLLVCCEVISRGVEDTPFLYAYGGSHLCWCLPSFQMTDSISQFQLEIRPIVSPVLRGVRCTLLKRAFSHVTLSLSNGARNSRLNIDRGQAKCAATLLGNRMENINIVLRQCGQVVAMSFSHLPVFRSCISTSVADGPRVRVVLGGAVPSNLVDNLITRVRLPRPRLALKQRY